jgi:hypothetical protein
MKTIAFLFVVLLPACAFAGDACLDYDEANRICREYQIQSDEVAPLAVPNDETSEGTGGLEQPFAVVPYGTGAETAKPSTSPEELERVKPRCAENGSCFGDISDLTGKPKNEYVGGYYRKSGTYVRSYYRSR